jgi:hypothetical protein
MNKKGRSTKKLGYFERNFFKNYQIFLEKLYENERFFGEILEWQTELKLTPKRIGDIFTIKSFKNHKLAHKYGVSLMKKVVKEKNDDFMLWFSEFFDRYNLSRNWEIPILNFIACGYFCPPETYNIEARQKGNDIIIRIEPGASSNDLIKAYSLFSEKFKKKPKRRISQNFFQNIKEQIQAFKVPKTSFDWTENKYKKLRNIDILYEVYGDDEEKLNELDKNQKKLVSRFKTNKNRLKRYIK